MAEFVIQVPGKPMSLNAGYAQADHWKRSKEAAAWREATAWHVKTTRWSPTLKPPYDVTVIHHCKTNRLMDHANIIIASKAILDELRTRGVIVDDSPKEVRNLIFARPRNSGRDAVEIRVIEVVDG